MSEPNMVEPAPDADEPVTLSAQHLTGKTTNVGEGVYVLRLGDGEQAVDITHEIGDPQIAAMRLEALVIAVREHAYRIRMRALTGLTRP